MTIKRMLLLLSAMTAFVAFAAPAVAQAGVFYSHETEKVLGGIDEQHTLDITGELSSTRGPLTSGPCVVHSSDIHLWNQNGMGHGTITNFSITASHSNPCPTSFSGIGCNIATFTNNTEEGADWTVTVVTVGGKAIAEITNVTFTSRYTGCGPIGIPDNAPVMVGPGTVTGEIENEEIIFEEAGDLELGGIAFNTNGAISLPGITVVAP